MIENNHFEKTFLFLKNLILIIPKSKVKHFQIVQIVQSFSKMFFLICYPTSLVEFLKINVLASK
jgi:hypothetical protein